MIFTCKSIHGTGCPPGPVIPFHVQCRFGSRVTGTGKEIRNVSVSSSHIDGIYDTFCIIQRQIHGLMRCGLSLNPSRCSACLCGKDKPNERSWNKGMVLSRPEVSGVDGMACGCIFQPTRFTRKNMPVRMTISSSVALNVDDSDNV